MIVTTHIGAIARGVVVTDDRAAAEEHARDCGRVVIEAELDTGSVARRLRRDISEVYGYTSGVSVLAGGNIRRGVRYLVRIAKHGEGLARQTGLVDQRGRPVRGLPPSVVSREQGATAARTFSRE